MLRFHRSIGFGERNLPTQPDNRGKGAGSLKLGL